MGTRDQNLIASDILSQTGQSITKFTEESE